METIGPELLPVACCLLPVAYPHQKNVGKHARGVTRIVVTGEERGGNYILKVQDNGCGLKPGKEQQGTKHSHLLAKRLGGKFRRESLPKGGVICELSWKVGELPKSAMITIKKMP